MGTTTPPGDEYVEASGIFGVFTYLVAIIIICIVALTQVWPCEIRDGRGERATTRPTTSAATTKDARQRATTAPTTQQAAAEEDPCHCPTCAITVLGLPVDISPEGRILAIVLLAGMLGATLHAAKSFWWYVGNRDLKVSWVWMYLLLPPIGAMLACIFYFAARAGMSGPISDRGVIGYAAMAGLVGMFSREATEKLKQIAETIFTKPPPGADHVAAGGAAPPTIQTVDPPTGHVAGGETVTIRGTNFHENATVLFGGVAAPHVARQNSTTLIVTTPKVTTPAVVDVTVINPDGFSFVKKGSFAYT
ncbi:MAG: hypothetical protein QOE14_1534 [Humisphaera sp.]|nr:hypothetical protein [Humisphaera sp.]